MSQVKILVAAHADQLGSLEPTLMQFEQVTLLTARNSREAILTARNEKPQLMIFDSELRTDEEESLSLALRQDPWLRNLPLIILTSGVPEQETELRRRWRCQQVLFKPVQMDSIARMLRDFIALFPLQSREMRRESNWPVRFGLTEQVLEGGLSIDLSVGGTFLQTPMIYTTSTRLFVEFSLPSCHEPIRCRARVAWFNRTAHPAKPSFPQGMGLQFLDLAAIHKEAILQFLAETQEATFH